MSEGIARWDPWMWIYSIFAVQLIGAVLVLGMLSLTFRELALPLGLLLLGTLIAFNLSRTFDASRSYAWERWLPAAIYAVFMYAMSNRSFSGAHLPVSSNVFHPFEYAFLAIFLSWAFYPLLSKGEVGLFSMVACGVLYGVSDEIHQYFIPGRSCSIEDIALDFLGVCTGLAIFLFALRKASLLRP